MSKKIYTIGYEIPGHSDNYVDFYSELSLMDADILLLAPDSLEPRGDWVSFTTSDGGCYNIATSKTYKQKISRLKKEIEDHLNSGKNIFILLTKKEEYSLANNVSVEKKAHNFSTETYSNYNFLPIDIGILTSASGKHIDFSANPIFSDFYKKFKKNLEYQLYIENPNNAQIIFTGKNKTKILGAVYKIGTGNLVVLPYLNYDYDKFVKTKKNKKGEEKEYWTDDALKFGNTFVDCLVQIDRDLSKSSEKTPTPPWVQAKKEFVSVAEAKLLKDIEVKKRKIANLKTDIEKLNIALAQEQVLKDLLFEQGKPLENAVIKALNLLGYNAENYDDGELELDQVITSPEGYRYIGESEGKNGKDIDITKLRQLIESMNADFAREDVEEKAFGILFGNPQRLTSPDKRTLDFTKKCKIGAKREQIALVKTADLFRVAKYLTENKDERFKKKCRETIHNGLGSVVVFPELPKKSKK